MTWTEGATPAMDLKRKMAEGRDPNKSRAPVRKPFPRLKLRYENRLWARRNERVWKWTKKAAHQLCPKYHLAGLDSPRIHSFLSSPIPSHNPLFPSTISIQRSFTTLSCASTGNRYDIRLYIASCSSSPFVRAFSGSGISLIRRDPRCQILID